MLAPPGAFLLMGDVWILRLMKMPYERPRRHAAFLSICVSSRPREVISGRSHGKGEDGIVHDRTICHGSGRKWFQPPASTAISLPSLLFSVIPVPSVKWPMRCSSQPCSRMVVRTASSIPGFIATRST